MARDAIAEWLQQSSPLPHDLHDDIRGMMRAEWHPPFEFIAEANRDEYKKAVVRYFTGNGNGESLSSKLDRVLNRPKILFNAIESQSLTRDDVTAIGLSPERVRNLLEKQGENFFCEMRDASRVEVVGRNGSYRMPDINTSAYRLACLKELGCLDLIDADRIADDIAAKQIALDWKAPPGYEEVNVERAAGLFHFGFCDLRSTRGALWTLQILGKLDFIDREACLEAILRLHKGRGVFVADLEDNIHIYGNEEDMFHALESLHILGGLDRVKDLGKWRFKPRTHTQSKSGNDLIVSASITSWAYQLRLEEIRGY